MNIIGGGLSTDIINKALKMVQEIEATTQKNTLISNIGSKMKTAGFVPAFLDGSFKSDYVDFMAFLRFTHILGLPQKGRENKMDRP